MFQEKQNPMPFDPAQVKKILESDAGKQLLQLLNRDGGVALQQAAACMKIGDLHGAQSAVAATMESEQAKSLLHQLEQERGR